MYTVIAIRSYVLYSCCVRFKSCAATVAGLTTLALEWLTSLSTFCALVTSSSSSAAFGARRRFLGLGLDELDDSLVLTP